MLASLFENEQRRLEIAVRSTITCKAMCAYQHSTLHNPRKARFYDITITNDHLIPLDVMSNIYFHANRDHANRDRGAKSYHRCKMSYSSLNIPSSDENANKEASI